MDRIYSTISRECAIHLGKDVASLVLAYLTVNDTCLRLPQLNAYIWKRAHDIALLDEDGMAYLGNRQTHFGFKCRQIASGRPVFRAPANEHGEENICGVCGAVAVGSIKHLIRSRTYQLYLCANCWQQPYAMMWIGDYSSDWQTLIDIYWNGTHDHTVGCATRPWSSACICYLNSGRH